MCGETQDQLELHDWDDTWIMTISDRPKGYLRNLWESLKGEDISKEIVLNDADLKSLAEALLKAVSK